MSLRGRSCPSPVARRAGGRLHPARCAPSSTGAASRGERADLAALPRVRAAARRAAATSSFARSSRELERRGLVVEHNRDLRAHAGVPLQLVQLRLRAPAALRAPRSAGWCTASTGRSASYRGFDDGTDARIAALNAELADATVLQSRYSLEKHAELGIELRDPVVIPNTVDPAIFHPPVEREPLDGRPLRVIASSWSENPRKGADVLALARPQARPDRVRR